MKVGIVLYAASWGLQSSRFADVNLVNRVVISLVISETKEQVEKICVMYEKLS